MLDKSVLISIHPSYVDKIVAGSKQIELRRRFPLDHSDIDQIFIYSTSPVKSIVAKAEISKVEQLSIDEIVEKRSKYIGVSEAHVRSYFHGLQFGFAIWLSEVHELANKIGIDDLDIIGVRRPPQSFRYVSSEKLRVLDRYEGADRHQHIHPSGRRRRAA